MEPIANNSAYKYVFTDEDGTKHYFKLKAKENPSDPDQWVDEDDTGLEIFGVYPATTVINGKTYSAGLYMSDWSGIESRFAIPQ